MPASESIRSWLYASSFPEVVLLQFVEILYLVLLVQDGEDVVD